jgi:hypothetical protein
MCGFYFWVRVLSELFEATRTKKKFGKHFYNTRYSTCDISWHPVIHVARIFQLTYHFLFVCLSKVMYIIFTVNLYLVYKTESVCFVLQKCAWTRTEWTWIPERHFQLQNTHVVKFALYVLFLVAHNSLMLAFLYCECLNGVKYIIPLFCYHESCFVTRKPWSHIHKPSLLY